MLDFDGVDGSPFDEIGGALEDIGAESAGEESEGEFPGFGVEGGEDEIEWVGIDDDFEEAQAAGLQRGVSVELVAGSEKAGE